MRQLKFRAWFSHHKKMVQSENLFLHYDGEDGFDFAFDKTVLDEEGNVEGTMNFEVMQYTGLKDKTGIEIYEGDIIQYEDSFNNGTRDIDVTRKEEVTFGLGTFGGGNDYRLYQIRNLAKVIGNIYENPELLGDTH